MPNSSRKKSLREIHPKEKDVPLLIVLSFIALVAGLSLPLITVQKTVLWRHWENHYSVLVGVIELYKQGDVLLAAVLFIFSMVFPFIKLFALLTIWTTRITDEQRASVLRWLELLGRWSMLDVFVVAILVVAAKLKSLTQVEPRAGVYLFGLAIILSMITTMVVGRLAKKSATS